MTKRLILLIAALSLMAAACGADEDAAGNGAPQDPAVSGACLAEDPNCEDTLDPGENPGELPPPDGENGVIVDNALTVSEAKATNADGTLAVRGFLVITETSGVRLCDALAESFPPQCGGPALNVGGFDETEWNLEQAQGVRWTNDWVTLFGTVDGDILVISDGTSG